VHPLPASGEDELGVMVQTTTTAANTAAGSGLHDADFIGQPDLFIKRREEARNEGLSSPIVNKFVVDAVTFSQSCFSSQPLYQKMNFHASSGQNCDATFATTNTNKPFDRRSVVCSTTTPQWLSPKTFL